MCIRRAYCFASGINQQADTVAVGAAADGIWLSFACGLHALIMPVCDYVIDVAATQRIKQILKCGHRARVLRSGQPNTLLCVQTSTCIKVWLPLHLLQVLLHNDFTVMCAGGACMHGRRIP